MTPLTQFHAHVYFDAHQRDQAGDLREEVVSRFALPVGRLFVRPIGPHSKGTFQIVFGIEEFASLVPWLMQHRGDLDVLVHGETGDDLVDHTQHVMWLGNSQTLYSEMFMRSA